MKPTIYIFFIIQFITCQDSSNIRIAFDENFWGTEVLSFKVNDKTILENDTLITDEVLGNAASVVLKNQKSTLNINTRMIHFKDGLISKYNFNINITGFKVLRFYMGIDRSTCKRVLKYELHKEDYTYY